MFLADKIDILRELHNSKGIYTPEQAKMIAEIYTLYTIKREAIFFTEQEIFKYLQISANSSDTLH